MALKKYRLIKPVDAEQKEDGTWLVCPDNLYPNFTISNTQFINTYELDSTENDGLFECESCSV